jgi:hypothetical protein
MSEPKTIDELAGLLVVPAGDADAGDTSGAADTEDTGDFEDTDASDEDGNSDEGTGEDGGDDESGEGEEAEAESGAEGDEPTVTVKVDGQDVKVTLAEALAGYQRTADYTRKTQEVAEARKAVDTEIAQARAHREQYANVLKVVQERIGPESQEPTAEQWDTLQRENPDQFAIEWAQSQRRQQARDTVKREQDRIAGEQQQEAVATLQKHVGEQRELLLAALPDWKEPTKAEAGMKAIREYGAKLGFSEAELDQAYDHRMIVAVDKARRYDALMAKQAATRRKVAQAPTMPDPGTRTRKDPKQADREAARTNFKRSGKIDDAVSLMYK